jgi:hypothetical protein
MTEESTRLKFPSKPLPVKLKKFASKIESDQFDGESWSFLVDGVFDHFTTDINTIRHWCERLLLLFPYCVMFSFIQGKVLGKVCRVRINA